MEVTHRGNVRRKYRVSGLTTQPTRELVSVSPAVYFLTLDGIRISFFWFSLVLTCEYVAKMNDLPGFP